METNKKLKARLKKWRRSGKPCGERNDRNRSTIVVSMIYHMHCVPINRHITLPCNTRRVRAGPGYVTIRYHPVEVIRSLHTHTNTQHFLEFSTRLFQSNLAP